MITLNTLRELKTQKKEIIYLDELNNQIADVEKSKRIQIGDTIANSDQEVGIPNTQIKVPFATLAKLYSSESAQDIQAFDEMEEENSKALTFFDLKIIADYIYCNSDDLSAIEKKFQGFSSPEKGTSPLPKEKFPTPPDALIKNYLPETPLQSRENSTLEPQTSIGGLKPLDIPAEVIAKAPSKESAKNFEDFLKAAYIPFPNDPEGLTKDFEDPKQGEVLPKGFRELITQILYQDNTVPVHFNDEVGPPIILVNNDPIAAVNLVNIKDFLLGKGFKKYDPLVDPESNHPEKVIVDRNEMKSFPHPLESIKLNQELPFQFEVVDNKYELTNDFLSRVVAIFGTGRDRQFGDLTADKVYHLEENVPFFHLVPPHTVREYNREDQKVYPKATIYDTNYTQKDWANEGVDINSTPEQRYQKRYYEFLNFFWSKVDQFVLNGQKHYINRYPYWLPNYDITKSKKRRTEFELVHGGASSKVSRIVYDMEFPKIDWSAKQVDSYKFMDDKSFS